MAYEKTKRSIAGMLALLCTFTASYEGLKTSAYPDIANGKYTICYGDMADVKKGDKKTPQECSLMLRAKLAVIGWLVWSLVDTPMTDERWAGLTDFSYNLGIGTFKKSMLRKAINDNDPKACDQILRYKYMAGLDCTIKENKCYGIIDRRYGEKDLCEGKSGKYNK